MRNRLRESLDSGKTLFGAFSVLSDPGVIEVMALVGFDFVGVELEHGPGSLEGLQNHHRAAQAAGVGLLVKCPADDPHMLIRVLDTGVDGVMLARVRDYATAKNNVEACRFPPLGTRGWSTITRAAGYGSQPISPAVIAQRNREVVVGIMAEDASTVRDIDRIVALPSLDFVFVGIADLSMALGVGGVASDPGLVEATQKVVSACKARGIPFGIPMDHVSYPLTGPELTSMGASLVIATSDTGALLRGLKMVWERTASH